MKVTKEQVSALASQLLKEAKKTLKEKTLPKEVDPQAKALAEKDWELIGKLSESFRAEHIGRIKFEDLIEFHTDLLTERKEEAVKFKSHKDISDEIILLAIECKTIKEIEQKIKVTED